MGSVEQVSDIKIFSNSPFRNAGNPSELLNQYFEIGWGETFSDIDAFVVTKPKFSTRSIKLRLKSRPDGASTHQFTIHYKQANGESYSTTTQEIMFK
ncbi:hypothetical protein WG906_13940 [Pedobacter sp. P351]|uniref:hypothetical protein n=1 Tax=Pedobacter superstes TaxID=3133441 RepID=UPI0030AE6AE2